jgi:uncharacterized protein YkwD
MLSVRCLAAFLLAGCALSVQADPPAAEEFKMTPREKEVVDLTNLERKKKDLPPLKPSPLLFKIARDHSANMAKQGKMEHILDKKTPFQRILAAGYDYMYAGENIAEADKDYTGKDIVKDWMESEKHRKNIMYPEFTEIGVGIIPGKKNLLYYTQVFGKPLRARKQPQK